MTIATEELPVAVCVVRDEQDGLAVGPDVPAREHAGVTILAEVKVPRHRVVVAQGGLLADLGFLHGSDSIARSTPEANPR